jgi:hypothetical protein
MQGFGTPDLPALEQSAITNRAEDQLEHQKSAGSRPLAEIDKAGERGGSAPLRLPGFYIEARSSRCYLSGRVDNNSGLNDEYTIIKAMARGSSRSRVLLKFSNPFKKRQLGKAERCGRILGHMAWLPFRPLEKAANYPSQETMPQDHSQVQKVQFPTIRESG